MSNIEKIYYNLDRLNDEYKDLDETKKADDVLYAILQETMDRDMFIKCEDVLCACMIAKEKQGFVYGFRYAVSLLTSGNVI